MAPTKRPPGLFILIASITFLVTVNATDNVHTAAASTGITAAGAHANAAIESAKSRAVTSSVNAAKIANARTQTAEALQVTSNMVTGAAAIEGIVTTTGAIVDRITAQTGAQVDAIYQRGMAEANALAQTTGRVIVATAESATTSIAHQVAMALNAINLIAEETACDIQAITARAFNLIDMNVMGAATAAKYGASIGQAIAVGATKGMAVESQHTMKALAAGLTGLSGHVH